MKCSTVSHLQGQIQSLERGVHFVEKVEDQKKKKKGEAFIFIILQINYTA